MQRMRETEYDRVRKRKRYLYRAYMFDFMFTMPAKLSVCLPVAITVSGMKTKKQTVF